MLKVIFKFYKNNFNCLQYYNIILVTSSLKHQYQKREFNENVGNNFYYDHLKHWLCGRAYPTHIIHFQSDMLPLDVFEALILVLQDLTWLDFTLSTKQRLSHVMSCHVMSCHVMWSFQYTSTRLDLTWLDFTLSTKQRLSHVMSCHVMSCHVIISIYFYKTWLHLTSLDLTSHFLRNRD